MSVLVVSGTGTGTGKTVVTAAIAVWANAGSLDQQSFLRAARASLAPALGGEFDPAEFERRHGWQHCPHGCPSP